MKDKPDLSGIIYIGVKSKDVKLMLNISRNTIFCPNLKDSSSELVRSSLVSQLDNGGRFKIFEIV